MYEVEGGLFKRMFVVRLCVAVLKPLVVTLCLVHATEFELRKNRNAEYVLIVVLKFEDVNTLPSGDVEGRDSCPMRR